VRDGEVLRLVDASSWQRPAALALLLSARPHRFALEVLPPAAAAGIALAVASAAWTGLPARAFRRPRTHGPVRERRGR
jgi:hypothetical protein